MSQNMSQLVFQSKPQFVAMFVAQLFLSCWDSVLAFFLAYG